MTNITMTVPDSELTDAPARPLVVEVHDRAVHTRAIELRCVTFIATLRKLNARER
jgi:hypothetical protein